MYNKCKNKLLCELTWWRLFNLYKCPNDLIIELQRTHNFGQQMPWNRFQPFSIQNILLGRNWCFFSIGVDKAFRLASGFVQLSIKITFYRFQDIDDFPILSVIKWNFQRWIIHTNVQLKNEIWIHLSRNGDCWQMTIDRGWKSMRKSLKSIACWRENNLNNSFLQQLKNKKWRNVCLF